MQYWGPRGLTHHSISRTSANNLQNDPCYSSPPPSLTSQLHMHGHAFSWPTTITLDPAAQCNLVLHQPCAWLCVGVCVCVCVCVHASPIPLHVHARKRTRTHPHPQGWCNTRLHCATGPKVIVAGHEMRGHACASVGLGRGEGRCNMDHVTFCKILADVLEIE